MIDWLKARRFIARGLNREEAAAAALTRADLATRFLDAKGWADAARAPISGDASARSYERLNHPRHGRAILMNAPPEDGVGPDAFAAVTGALRARGLSAPEIFATDYANGFLLIEDFGDDLFARVAATDPAREVALYEAAAELLAKLHEEAAPETIAGYGVEMPLKPYDRDVLIREARLLLDWWLPGATGAAPSAEAEDSFLAALDAICAPLAEARSALVLRDYHSENLLWLPDRDGHAAVGLLDYQDALAGHPAYDLVSLIEDARRDVSPEAAEAALTRYAQATGEDPEALRWAVAALGAQRNAKIVGIFARLRQRDGKPRYLSMIPRVWSHLMRDLEHPALKPLRDWMIEHGPAPTRERLGALERLRGPAEKPVDGDAAEIDAAKIDTAMILAAGLGTRMRPLTDSRPKPLLECAGATLLDRAIDRAKEVGAERMIVNTHYLGEQVVAHLERRHDADFYVSEERARPLETGGGVKRALPAIARDVFLTVNSDNVWSGDKAFQPLLDAWRAEEMDALLLLVPIERARGYTRSGDFFLAPGGRLIRRGAAKRAPLVYTGAQLLTRRSFAETPDDAFSLNIVWDRLIAAGRAFGVVHSGDWVDVGTPDGLAEAARMLTERRS